MGEVGGRECIMHGVEGGEGGEGKRPCTRDRKHREQCVLIRFWEVNTRWQQSCHAGQEHSEALMCSVAGRVQGLMVRLFTSSMAHVLTILNTLFLHFQQSLHRQISQHIALVKHFPHCLDSYLLIY